MAARLALLAPRLIALVVIWLLAAASWTLAAGGGQATTPVAAPAASGPATPDVLVVPDVRRQAYVFSKGILQDAGFAWRVQGAVKGYSANTVVAQTPAPGVRVVDNGSPTVVLQLARNTAYAERGIPENAAPYKGTPVVLMSDWRAANEETETAPAPTETQPAATPPPTTTAPTPTAPATETTPAPAAPAAPADETQYRKPDFIVANAAREPRDELPLPERARRLERRTADLAKPSRRFVDYWLYQHNWIVTGARFGWRNADDALRILLRVDRSLQARFGLGARSEQVARRALAYVESRRR